MSREDSSKAITVEDDRSMLSLEFRKDTSLAVIFHLYVPIYNIKSISAVKGCVLDWVLYVPVNICFQLNIGTCLPGINQY